MMKTNIAEMLSSTYDGGAETLVKDYCLHLDKNKFNIVVIVFRRYFDTAVDTVLTKNGIRIVSIYKNNDFFSKVIQKLNSWWYIPLKLKRIIKQEQINVLHGHIFNLRWLYRIRKFLLLRNIKLFYTCHNLPNRYFSGKNKKDGMAAKYLINYNYLRIIALHDDMRKEINEMFGVNNTVVIRNGIDFQRFKNIKETKEEIRKILGIQESAFVLGHIGRFHEQKNHGFLLDVFNEVLSVRDDAFLLLIGAGPLQGEIEDKIRSLNLQDHVLMLSHRTDIPQILRAVDVFVFPSKYEGLSVTLVEAQVSGLRCIVSDRVNRETIMSDTTVLLSIDDTPKKWCETILNPSIKGRAYSNIEDYDVNKEIKHLEELYVGEING